MMESVFRGEIRERRRRLAVLRRKPAGMRGNVRIKFGHDQVVILQKFLIARRVLQSFLWQ